MTDVGRTAILRAARKAFARKPYAEVTLRGIAADAKVSASLIVKHFGGKESLFDAASDFSEAAELLLAAPNEELGRHAVQTLVRWRRENGVDLMIRVIFAAGIGDERAIIRERFHDQVVRAFADRLSGEPSTYGPSSSSPTCSAWAQPSPSTSPAPPPPPTPPSSPTSTPPRSNPSSTDHLRPKNLGP